MLQDRAATIAQVSGPSGKKEDNADELRIELHAQPTIYSTRQLYSQTPR